MGRKSYRAGRSNLVSRAIEGENGWNRDPFAVQAGQEWSLRFPGLPFVADGREETGFTRAGRGTTAFDLFRKVEGSSLVRFDFLSIKTDTIDESGKLPSKLELSTGNQATQDAILAGINAGASLPTLLFVSENDEFGEARSDGFAVFLDLAPVLRRGIAPITAGPYGRGEAPEAYFKWASARPCGGGGKALSRALQTFPNVDEQGRKWVAADKVCYPQLIVSLHALNIHQENWTPVQAHELAEYLEGQNWPGDLL